MEEEVPAKAGKICYICWRSLAASAGTCTKLLLETGRDRVRSRIAATPEIGRLLGAGCELRAISGDRVQRVTSRVGSRRGTRVVLESRCASRARTANSAGFAAHHDREHAVSFTVCAKNRRKNGSQVRGGVTGEAYCLKEQTFARRCEKESRQMYCRTQRRSPRWKVPTSQVDGDGQGRLRRSGRHNERAHRHRAYAQAGETD
ncbi:hypothetical protein OH77DRAFT_460043 [Trametes cingulata]|nr:hypothetical protein OH77DRAFT_460043 [Trametes cingulata]